MDPLKLTQEFDQLPAMPNIMIRALNVIKDETTGIKDLSDIMSSDQSLTTKVLRVVNSAYYGLAQEITSIERALLIMGMKEANNIILAAAMRPMLTSQGGRDLWAHYLKCAIGCEFLATKYKLIAPTEAFIVGFLHDFGKMLLNKKNTILFSKVKNLEANGIDVIEAEDALFKTNHCDVGFILAKKWQLPLLIANTIKYHHNPLKSSMKNIAFMVWIADNLVKEKEQKILLNPEMMQLCSIKIDNPDELREEILEKSSTLISQLS